MSVAATSRFGWAKMRPATSRCRAALSAGGAGCRRGDALSDIYLVIQWTAAAAMILGFSWSANQTPSLPLSQATCQKERETQPEAGKEPGMHGRQEQIVAQVVEVRNPAFRR